MRKLFISLLLILQIVFLFTACSDSAAAVPRVLEISSGSLSEISKDANHTNEIRGDYKITFDSEASEKNSIKLGEYTFTLEYKETSSSDFGVESVFASHIYTIPESQLQNTECKISQIMLYSNGEIQRLVSNIEDSLCMIDGITPQTSEEDAIRLVQEQLSQYIDFNRYQYAKIYNNSTGLYFIHWYNAVEGIETDSIDRLYISLHSDGRISQIIFPPSKPVISLEQYAEGFKKCPKSTHEALIKAKLDQIYKTDKTDYNENNYNIPDDYVQLTVYDGKPAVLYGVEADIKRSSNTEYYRELAKILIVLE